MAVVATSKDGSGTAEGEKEEDEPAFSSFGFVTDNPPSLSVIQLPLTTVLFGASVRSYRTSPLSSFLSTVHHVLPFHATILALGDAVEWSPLHAADGRIFLSLAVPASFLRPDHQLLPDMTITASWGSLVLLCAPTQ